MKQVERDFITLFNCLWYRDFPVNEQNDLAGRADWTIHLGLVVRQCATLLGARALFEQGGRTDAVIRYSNGDTLSYVEWEWKRAHTDINEIDKLIKRCESTVFQTFIGYTEESELQTTLNKINDLWADAQKPLIFFAVTFERNGKSRRFLELTTYFFAKGKRRKIRTQPALPWEINHRQENSVSDQSQLQL